MDNSGSGGRFLSGPNGGFLDLESPIQRHQHTQLLSSMAHPHQMNLMGGLDADHQPIGLVEMKGSEPKGCFSNFGKGKAVCSYDAINSSGSEDDELSLTEDGNGENSNGAKGKKGSPWQRMKWTDDVVSLLIAVVASVDDDGTLDGVEGLKRKSGILQKKGKWKTVSKIMMGKGCQVSPQQCEDKFNDLNKRYKKLNEILGRGTSCRVVENPALMDSMPHLSAKAKDDVRKMLSSKHLFYKEMCSYHNGQRMANCHDLDLQASLLPLERSPKDDNGSVGEADVKNESDNDESDNEDDNNADEDGEEEGKYAETKIDEENALHWSRSEACNNFEVEMAMIFENPAVSQRERKAWLKKQMLQLMEQRVSLQAQAFELEKQRLKWLRYCAKKDREFERMGLENERMKLENEQRVLQLRQKQLEMEFRNSEPSVDLAASLEGDGLQARDDLGRHR